MPLADHIADFLSWWPCEFGALLGRRAVEAVPETDMVLRFTRDGILVESGRRDQPSFEPVLVSHPGEVASVIGQLLPKRMGRELEIALLIDNGRYLKRRVSGMRLPRTRIHAMAVLDVQSSTPFSVDDLYLILPRYDEEVADSSYYAVKRAVLEPALDDLRSAGLAPSFLGLVDGQRIVVADAVSFSKVAGRSKPGAIRGRLLVAGAAVAAVGLVASLGVAHWRYSSAARSIDAEISVLEKEVVGLRALIASRDARITQIAAVREEKRATVPLVSIIEEMSRAIPNSTWLTEISVSGDRVTFSGFSVAAATLIPLLEASPLFRSPS